MNCLRHEGLSLWHAELLHRAHKKHLAYRLSQTPRPSARALRRIRALPTALDSHRSAKKTPDGTHRLVASQACRIRRPGNHELQTNAEEGRGHRARAAAARRESAGSHLQRSPVRALWNAIETATGWNPDPSAAQRQVLPPDPRPRRVWTSVWPRPARGYLGRYSGRAPTESDCRVSVRRPDSRRVRPSPQWGFLSASHGRFQARLRQHNLLWIRRRFRSARCVRLREVL